MIVQEEITVSGERVKLRPYTERRLSQLVEIQQEIQEYIEANPEMGFDEIDKKKVAKWWKRKAEVLWETQEPLPLSFFESPDFEVTWLKKSEDFFLASRVYL
jgi:hypothetical protein